MAEIHIEKAHSMGLVRARKTAFQWAEQVKEKFDMRCTYEEGATADEVSFTRSGVSGTLQVNKDSFVLDAKLGFLLGAFKDRIEGEIEKNLDSLINEAPAKAPAGTKKPAAK